MRDTVTDNAFSRPYPGGPGGTDRCVRGGQRDAGQNRRCGTSILPVGSPAGVITAVGSKYF